MNNLKKLLLLLWRFCAFAVQATCWPRHLTPLPNPSQDVAARLNQLEAETQALRTKWNGCASTRFACPKPVRRQPAWPVASTDFGRSAEGNYVTLEELPGEIKKFAWKKGDFTIAPYGYLWGNMVYSTERTNPGSYTLFVLSGSTGAGTRIHRGRTEHPAGVRRRRPADSVLQLRHQAAARWKSTSKTACSRPRTSRPSCCGTPMPK